VGRWLGDGPPECVRGASAIPGDARLVRAGVFAPRVVEEEALADCGNARILVAKKRRK
jgi:hypothetical protein